MCPSTLLVSAVRTTSRFVQVDFAIVLPDSMVFSTLSDALTSNTIDALPLFAISLLPIHSVFCFSVCLLMFAAILGTSSLWFACTCLGRAHTCCDIHGSHYTMGRSNVCSLMISSCFKEQLPMNRIQGFNPGAVLPAMNITVVMVTSGDLSSREKHQFAW